MTTDTNLQIVNSMTQSKLNELKNSEGKVPSLANQLVITDDNGVDESLEYTRTEVVYDMTSSDSSINWGYPNGIGTGVTINKDFSKYDFLVCQYLSYNNSIVGFCDLSQPTIPSDTTGRYVMYAVAYVQNGYQELIGIINLEKTTLTTYLPGSGVVAVKIAKIYGILKTPSMIYTGDELIAGNGISIANGVISSNSGQLVVDYKATGNVSGITIEGLDINADGGIYDIVFEGYSPNGQAPLHLRVNEVTTKYNSTLMRVSSNNTATGTATGQFYTFLNSNETGWFIGDLVTAAVGAYHITLIADGNSSVQMISNFTALQDGMVNGGFSGGQLYNSSGLNNITSLYFWAYGGKTLSQARVRIYKRATNSQTRG